MSFLSCFYFGIQFISTINAEKAESLYPYDFMCVADKSDDKLFEKNKKKSIMLTLTEYPMVRVANADKTEHLEGRGRYYPGTTDWYLGVYLLQVKKSCRSIV